MSAELASSGLRASHEDRDRVVEVLAVAAGDGRLTAEELDERVGVALSARTMGELAALTTDLPEAAEVAEVKDVVRIEQQGSSTRRGEGWVVPRRMEIHSAWGDVTLDFSRADIRHDTLRIDLDMQAGALRLVTRPGVVVDTDGLVTHFAEIKTDSHTGVPVVLRVELVGELSYGRVVARAPRRRWFRKSPKP
ncbi:DUF1707 domain-containing protein [Streptomyces sp. GESEQ-35]|uniref:DUF1707 SHOCT-like domain-containing protein n=1 Tax=Streptomyces sp. GESEQ-35 TaxID=2812657 RepID=UPI001B3431D0|nr:DUF1707 domain-containing protein [Streptomyces sp. GESEQ-35]